MKLKLYAHPFSSYSQKVLIALYANQTPFEFRTLSPEHAENVVEHTTVWPLRKFPVLMDGDRSVIEASIIIEYLDSQYPGEQRFIPSRMEASLDVRFMDRFFDNYVMTPMQAIVGDALRPVDLRDAHGVNQAQQLLDSAYAWLEQRMTARTWASGEGCTLADCAAAPSLFYADWVRPIGNRFPALSAYRQHLRAWPAFARVVDEARPYRPLFPLGAPDRD